MRRRLPVVYLRSAQEDLAEILQYIRRDSPSNAEAWIKRVDRALGRLAAYPESGAAPRDERLAALGYRIVVIGEHLAFYLVRDARVEIRRVLHGRRRYSFLL